MEQITHCSDLIELNGETPEMTIAQNDPDPAMKAKQQTLHLHIFNAVTGTSHFFRDFLTWIELQDLGLFCTFP